MNASFTTDALVLRTRQVGERSGVIHLFSQTNGPLEIYHRGLFSKGNAAFGIMDLGHLVWIKARTRETNTFLEKCKLIRAHQITHYEDLTLLSYALELLLKWPKSEGHFSPDHMYQDAKALLESLGQGKGKFNALLYFEFQLLKHLGILGDLTHCCSCEKELDAEATVCVHPGEWNAACTRCSNKTKAHLYLERSELQTLLRWYQSGYSPDSGPSLPKSSVIKIQKHLNGILEDYYKLTTVGEVMRIMQNPL